MSLVPQKRALGEDKTPNSLTQITSDEQTLCQAFQPPLQSACHASSWGAPVCHHRVGSPWHRDNGTGVAGGGGGGREQNVAAPDRNPEAQSPHAAVFMFCLVQRSHLVLQTCQWHRKTSCRGRSRAGRGDGLGDACSFQTSAGTLTTHAHSREQHSLTA